MGQIADERAAVTAMVRAGTPGQLPAEARAILEERKAINLMAAKIAGLSWGQSFDLETRRTLAEYGRQRGIDIATEIHVLGGRIYKNADYYLNRAQPFVRAGVMTLGYEYVNHDKRLDALVSSSDAALAAKAKTELDRRTWLRIEFNIPDAAHSAVVATLTLPKTGFTYRAAKWCGNGVRKNDPVGEGNPEATAVTRALRKVIRVACGEDRTVSQAFGEDDGEVVAELEEVLVDQRQHAREDSETWARQTKMHDPIPGVEYDAETGIDTVSVPRQPVDPDGADYYDGVNDELPLDDARAPDSTDALRHG